MLLTTIAGSLTKPEWLAEPNRLWASWRAEGAALEAAKRGATLPWLKLEEDAGIDIVTDGERSRQHFVHGFLERIDGIDFTHKIEMGIRKNRYKAMVPRVTGALRLNGRVHAVEARLARAHTARKLKFTLPGPMTIVDTIADMHYGDKVAPRGSAPPADTRGTARRNGGRPGRPRRTSRSSRRRPPSLNDAR